MTENEVRHLLPQYLDGSVSSEQAREVESALAQSRLLQSELEQWRALQASCVRTHCAVPVPAGLAAKVSASLAGSSELGDGGRSGSAPRHATNPTANVPLRSPQPAIIRLFGGMTAVAAAIVIMVAFWWGPGVTPAVAQDVAPASFVDIYRLCAVQHQHRELPDTPHDLLKARTAAEKQIKVCQLPNLKELGFELDGICFCSKIDGAKVVHAYYRRGGDSPAVVSVFNVDHAVKIQGCRECCGKAPCGSDRTYELASERGVILLSWRCAERTITVCSELPEDEVRLIAGRIADMPHHPARPAVARAGR